MNVRNFQPAYCPLEVMEGWPKATLADVAFNFAMRICEDDTSQAKALLIKEAASCHDYQKKRDAAYQEARRIRDAAKK